jgi:hypothetical protein
MSVMAVASMTDINGAADPAYPLAASGRICSSIWGGRRSRSHDRAYDHRKPSGGPPRVDRAVMLPEFADMGAPEKPASARFAPGPLTRLASSTAPVALRQSRILRTTRHVLH